MSGARPKLLLVGWEGADWNVARELVASGRMPHLERLAGRGVLGHVATLEPQATPLLWTSIATGHWPDRHGVLGDLEPDPVGTGVRATGSHTSRVPALWNLAAAHGLRSLVVGWPGTHPAEPVAGVVVSELFARMGEAGPDSWPLAAGAVAPAAFAEPLAALRLHPADLGIEHLLPFAPGAARAHPRHAPGLAGIAQILAEATSAHAAATWLLERECFDFAAVCTDLIDRVSHAFMALRAPRRAGVSREAHALYGGAVDMAYEHCDRMLARLVELAGPNATVLLVSDHGFHSDQRRPAAVPDGRRGDTAWHRDYGFLALAGPGVRADEWVFGADLLSIAPTALAILGVPLPRELPGRALWEAFESPPAARVAEESPATSAPTAASSPIPGGEAALARLVEHGFATRERIDAPDAARCEADTLALHAALVRLQSRRAADALPLLEDLHRRHPTWRRVLLHLARCREALGQIAESRRLMQDFVARGRPSALSHLQLARLDLAEGRLDDALVQLFEAEQAQPDRALLHAQIGEVYLQMRRPDEAERAFGRALGLDPDLAEAHLGVARAALSAQRFDAAAEAALDAIARRYRFPLAHYHLGAALVRLGRPRDAIRAFETALAQQPTLREAHDALAGLHEHVTGDVASALLHRAQAQRPAR